MNTEKKKNVQFARELDVGGARQKSRNSRPCRSKRHKLSFTLLLKKKRLIKTQFCFKDQIRIFV